MPIKPFDLQEKVEIPDEIHQVLIDAGIEKDSVNNPTKKDAQRVFNAAGASIDEAAKQIANIMSRGETDAGRLKAAELVLKVHDVMHEIDEKSIPNITINISGSEGKTLINLVLPTV